MNIVSAAICSKPQVRCFVLVFPDLVVHLLTIFYLRNITMRLNRACSGIPWDRMEVMLDLSGDRMLYLLALAVGQD